MEVEEREVNEAGVVLSSTTSRSNALMSGNDIGGPSALIRDSSRNRLQRLGALYSESENLSSPIHRNQSRFDEENIPAGDGASGVSKLKGRFTKLADLASSINSWEDESMIADGKDEARKVAESTKPSAVTKTNEPKIVGMCPRRNEGQPQAQPKGKKSSEKNIRWDPKVMNALESQGFKRRETANTHLEYEYEDGQKGIDGNRDRVDAVKGGASGGSVNVKQVSSALAANKFGSAAAEKKQSDRKPVQISKNIVSGRAAIFESTNPSERRPGKPTVDPAEMSLRDRLALFEKNKGTALVPKAALGMSVSAKQIAADQNAGKCSDVKKPIISVGGGGGVIGGTSHMPSHSALANAASKVAGFNKAGMYLLT